MREVCEGEMGKGGGGTCRRKMAGTRKGGKEIGRRRREIGV